METDQIARIEQISRDLAPLDRWPVWCRAGNEQPLSAAGMRQLYRDCFADWDRESWGPAPMWVPDAKTAADSNVGRWMAERGFDHYGDFHRWSTEHRAEFWADAAQRLGIRFAEPPVDVLDLTRGPTQVAWFAGAKLNIVDSCFQADPDAPAVVAQQPGGPIRTWTCRELQQKACQVANGLVDAGLKVGDAVGVLMPMTDWSVAIYLGIVMAGCHVVSIADSFAPPEIETRLRISAAKLVFTYDCQLRAGKEHPLYRRLVEAADTPAVVLNCQDVLSVDLRDQDFSWAEFLASRTEFEPVISNVQETINVLFSSGTTGDPKAIPWNQLTPLKCAVDGYCHQDIHPGDVCAWPTNLGWMMGPWLIFASLINRATIALYEDAPVGTGFGRFVQEAGVTMLGVVPTIVKAWETSQSMEACDWSRIKVFSSTGESSQPETMIYLSSLAGFKPVIEYCGGTEIGGGYVTSVVLRPNVPAAFNTPAVGIDFVLLEPEERSAEGVPLQPGADQGEVFLIPPSIGLSQRLINRDHDQTYYADTPQVAGLGQLRRHGDYFRRIEAPQGTLLVAGGRVDDTMNLGGIKISSAEIERVLNQVQGVRETAAVSIGSTGGPDQLMVFVVAESTSIDPVAMQTTMNLQLKRDLNPLFRISRLLVVDSLPRTASGKVMRRMLRTDAEV